MLTCRNLLASLMLVALSICLGMGCVSPHPEFRGERSIPGMRGDSLLSQDVNGVSGGKLDRENLWRTTVNIQSNAGVCSGILIAPKAVLTAAHCFCAVTQAAFDRSSCVKRATVISHLYLYRPENRGWEPIPATSEGDVIVHEEFTSQRTSKGFVDPAKRVADLAIVALDKELDGLKPDVLLRPQDVSEGDELTVIGYGPTRTNGSDGSVRRSGTNTIFTVTRFPNERVREFRFNGSGAHTHDGDSGGPALYLDDGKRWLVGINGGYSEQGKQSWFTATSTYDGWIKSQIAKAMRPRAP